MVEYYIYLHLGSIVVSLNFILAWLVNCVVALGPKNFDARFIWPVYSYLFLRFYMCNFVRRVASGINCSYVVILL